VPNRRLSLRVPDEELARRRAQWKPRAPHFTRGYGRLFLDHVLQAHEGCDFDFLRGKTPVRAEDTAGPSHSLGARNRPLAEPARPAGPATEAGAG
jgi:hypothetical protein